MAPRILLLLALSIASCDAPPAPPKAEPAAPAPADQSGRALSLHKKFWVEYTPSVNPIPFNQIFSLMVRVADPEHHDRTLDVSLDEVRVTMPAHGHGMKVQHTIEPGATPGTFIVKGLQLHMNGEGENGRWAFAFVIHQGQTIDQASFDVQCCLD
jgi:hypothetical protein